MIPSDLYISSAPCISARHAKVAVRIWALIVLRGCFFIFKRPTNTSLKCSRCELGGGRTFERVASQISSMGRSLAVLACLTGRLMDGYLSGLSGWTGLLCASLSCVVLFLELLGNLIAATSCSGTRYRVGFL